MVTAFIVSFPFFFLFGLNSRNLFSVETESPRLRCRHSQVLGRAFDPPYRWLPSCLAMSQPELPSEVSTSGAITLRTEGFSVGLWGPQFSPRGRGSIVFPSILPGCAWFHSFCCDKHPCATRLGLTCGINSEERSCFLHFRQMWLSVPSHQPDVRGPVSPTLTLSATWWFSRNRWWKGEGEVGDIYL